jgi:amino acid transporter
MEAFSTFAITDNGSPWAPLARTVWSPLGTVLVVVLFTSMFGNQNAAFNTLTRTWYAMGRDGLLPAVLARTHARYQSPYIAASAQLVISLVIVAFGAMLGATRVFVFAAAVSTALLIVTYIIANVSCIAFYARRDDLRVWLHIGVPLVGVIGLLPVLCAALGVGSSWLPFVSPLKGPAAYAGLAVALSMGAGVCVLAYLWWRRPDALQR